MRGGVNLILRFLRYFFSDESVMFCALLAGGGCSATQAHRSHHRPRIAGHCRDRVTLQRYTYCSSMCCSNEIPLNGPPWHRCHQVISASARKTSNPSCTTKNVVFCSSSRPH